MPQSIVSFLFAFSIIAGYATNSAAQGKIRIMLPDHLAGSLNGLKENYPNLELVPQGNPEKALMDIADCDAYIGVDLDAKALEAAKKLR